MITSDFVLKTKYNIDKTELENKIPNISGLVKKTDYNSNITETENKIPDISNLATKAALTTVENKIPSISNLATKTALTPVENKIPDISNLVRKGALIAVENKIPNINNLATKTLVNKVEHKIPNISSLVKKSDYNAKITSIKNNVRQLQAYDLSYLKGKQYFDEGSGKQNYLVFLQLRKYFKLNSAAGVVDHVLSWQSKGISNESFKSPVISDNTINPRLNYYGTKTRVQFTGSCLKQSDNIFIHEKVVNIYIGYELGASTSHTSDPTMKNCIFGAITLTTNDDIEKYNYSGYGIGFNRISSGGFGQNVLIFGADMSTSTHVDNKKKDILVIGRGPTQGLENTLTAGKMYSINFTVKKKNFCLSLHYNGANVNGTEIIKFKVKDSNILASPLCLGNISKAWSTDNMKKTGFNGNVYDFSVDYNAVTVDSCECLCYKCYKDIHKYLMKKNDVV